MFRLILCRFVQYKHNYGCHSTWKHFSPIARVTAAVVVPKLEPTQNGQEPKFALVRVCVLCVGVDGGWLDVCVNVRMQNHM